LAFQLTDEQLKRLSEWRRTLDEKENIDWYASVKGASAKYNQILTDAGFPTGKDLSSDQLEQLFSLMRQLSNNRALSRLLYEENGIAEFNKRLRVLLFGKESIVKRVDQFNELKGVKEVTMSHFLCLKDIQGFPYVTHQTYKMLELEGSQESNARTQALSEYAISNPSEYHSSTIDYLTDWVMFRAVKDALHLESFPQVNVLLWDAYEAEGQEERPQVSVSLAERELYAPIRKWLEQNFAPKSDTLWVKETAYQARRGQPGKWSRPDIICVEVNWFDYLPQKYVEVTSFEVKKHDGYNLSSVYEAASHQRWAHKTYLVIEVPNAEASFAAEIESEAVRFGVGVMKTYKKDAAGAVDLEVVVEPALKNPEPRELDKMLADFFVDDEKGMRKYKNAIGK